MQSMDSFSVKYIFNLLTFYFKGVISYRDNILTVQNPRYQNYIVPLGYKQKVQRREVLENCTCNLNIRWTNLLIAILDIGIILAVVPSITQLSYYETISSVDFYATLTVLFKRIALISIAAFLLKSFLSSNHKIRNLILFVLLFVTYKLFYSEIISIVLKIGEALKPLFFSAVVSPLTVIINSNRVVFRVVYYICICLLGINSIGHASWIVSYELFINQQYLTSFFVTEKKKAFACRDIIASLINNNEKLFMHNIQFFNEKISENTEIR